MRQLFCSSLLFCFRELNRFLKISVWDLENSSSVLKLELDPQNPILDPRKSKLKIRASKISRIKNLVLSQDCQLTFERYCKLNVNKTAGLQSPSVSRGSMAGGFVLGHLDLQLGFRCQIIPHVLCCWTVLFSQPTHPPLTSQ